MNHLHENERLFTTIRYFRYEAPPSTNKQTFADQEFRLALKAILTLLRRATELRFIKSTILPPPGSPIEDQFYTALAGSTHLDDLQIGDHSNQIQTGQLAKILSSFRSLTRLKARIEVPSELDDEGDELELDPLAVCDVHSLTLVLTGAVSNKRLLRLADATFAQTQSLVLDLTKSGTITPEGVKEAMARLPPTLHRLGFYAPKAFPSTVPRLFAE